MSDEIESARHRQRVINAYKRAFDGADGKLILDDLTQAFGLQMPAFLPSATASFDPIHAAIRDGQRQVQLHIQARLSGPNQGDANIESPKTKVKK